MKNLAHWPHRALEEVAEIQTGMSKSSTRGGDLVELPYLRVANVQDGSFDLSIIKTIGVPKDKLERFSVKDGDVLLTEGGDFDKLGRGAIWQGQIQNCVHQNHLFVVRPNPSILDTHFFAYQTSGPNGRAYFQSCAKRSTNLASINSTQLRQFPVALPPLSEQKKIAEVLGTWDRAIETQQNLIDSLTRRKKALMQQLLTGKTRLPGFEDEWLDVKLGDYFKERRERNHNNLKLLAITAKDGIVDRNSLTKTDTSNADKSKYLRITPGDIGYNTMRMWQGVSGLSTMEGIVSPAYTILKPTEDVHPEFAAYLFKLPSLIFRFKRYSQGLVDDTLSLKYTAFKIIKSSIPTTKEEQQAIAKVLTAADQEIQLHTQHLTSLRTQKRGLMQQFLTGKTRVLITKPASPIN